MRQQLAHGRRQRGSGLEGVEGLGGAGLFLLLSLLLLLLLLLLGVFPRGCAVRRAVGGCWDLLLALLLSCLLLIILLAAPLALAAGSCGRRRLWAKAARRSGERACIP